MSSPLVEVQTNGSNSNKWPNSDVVVVDHDQNDEKEDKEDKRKLKRRKKKSRPALPPKVPPGEVAYRMSLEIDPRTGRMRNTTSTNNPTIVVSRDEPDKEASLEQDVKTATTTEQVGNATVEDHRTPNTLKQAAVVLRRKISNREQKQPATESDIKQQPKSPPTNISSHLLSLSPCHLKKSLTTGLLNRIQLKSQPSSPTSEHSFNQSSENNDNSATTAEQQHITLTDDEELIQEASVEGKEEQAAPPSVNNKKQQQQQQQRGLFFRKKLAANNSPLDQQLQHRSELLTRIDGSSRKFKKKLSSVIESTTATASNTTDTVLGLISSRVNKSKIGSSRFNTSGIIEPQPTIEDESNKQQLQIVEKKRASSADTSFVIPINNTSSAVILSINKLTSMATREKFESLIGSDLKEDLICDFSNRIPACFLNSGGAQKAINISMTNQASSSSISKYSPSELLEMKRQRALELSDLEDKQATLCNILNSVYQKLHEENQSQQMKLIDLRELAKIFNAVTISLQMSNEVHKPVAQEIRERCCTQDKWSEKPYFGDILVKYQHYYKIYLAVVGGQEECQKAYKEALAKKKTFIEHLQKLLDAQAKNLQLMTRLDILLEHLYKLPFRNSLLLESYLKLLEPNTTEYNNILKFHSFLSDIHQTTNETLIKTDNFQRCIKLKENLEISNRDDAKGLLSKITDIMKRFLIKSGPIYKVSKRKGECLMRHFMLFTDMLIISSVSMTNMLLSKKLKLNKLIPISEIKAIEFTTTSSGTGDSELTFRIISLDQNNEFLAEDKKNRDDWLNAFRKVNSLEVREEKEHPTVGQFTNSDSDATTITCHQLIMPGEKPPIWIPDQDQVACSGCKELFSAIRRRHHCRTCGRIYCDQGCWGRKIRVRFDNFRKDQTVCESCFYYLEPIYKQHLASKTKEQQQSKEKQQPQQEVASIAVKIEALLPSQALIAKEDEEEEEKKKVEVDDSTSIAVKCALTEEEIREKFKNILRPKKVTRQSSGEEDGEDDRPPSSPLTEEQMQVVAKYFETKTPETTSEEDDESVEENATTTKKDNSSIVEFPVEHLIELKNETKNESNGDVHQQQSIRRTVIVVTRPPPPPPPSSRPVSEYQQQEIALLPSAASANSSASSSSSLSSPSPSGRGKTNKSTMSVTEGNCSATNTPQQLQHRVSSRLILASRRREPLYFDYAYVARIPVHDHHRDDIIDEIGDHETAASLHNETPADQSLPSDVEISSSVSRKETGTKWERFYIIYYADKRIGLCPNHHCTNNPTYLPSLNTLDLRDINETTLGLNLNVTGAAAITLSTGENATIAVESAATSTPERRSSLGGSNNSGSNLLKRVKLFEYNYQLKFQKEETKKKWFDILNNEKKKLSF